MISPAGALCMCHLVYSLGRSFVIVRTSQIINLPLTLSFLHKFSLITYIWLLVASIDLLWEKSTADWLVLTCCGRKTLLVVGWPASRTRWRRKGQRISAQLVAKIQHPTDPGTASFGLEWEGTGLLGETIHLDTTSHNLKSDHVNVYIGANATKLSARSV